MKKIFSLIALSYIFLVTQAFADTPVDATVNAEKIGLNETITLTLHSDSSTGFRPDFSVLNNDFKILGMSSSSQTSIANGNATQQKSWIVVLMPKHTGTITIPAFDSGGAKTSPITVIVSEDSQTPANTDAAKTLFLKSTLSSQDTYAGYNAIYDLKIYYDAYIRTSPQLTLPAVEGVEFIPLENSKNYTDMYENKRYNVLEQRYALVAQKPNTYTIPPATLQGEMYDSDNTGTVFDADWIPFKKTSNSLTLVVKGAPMVAENTWWLPASSVTLKDSWEKDTPVFEKGQPVTRTLTLEASGVKGEQLPELQSQEVSGFQLYPDKPQLETQVQNGALLGKRSEKIAYIPSQSGEVELPAVTVSWWNVKTNTLEKVTLPGKKVLVRNSEAGSSATNKLALNEPMHIEQASKNSMGNSFEKTKLFSSSVLVFMTFTLLFIWIVTLIAWWYHARKQRKTVPTPTPHLSHEHVESLRYLKREIETACKNNNNVDAKTNLLLLAQKLWTAETFLSLGDVAEKFDSLEAKNLLKTLDESLYGADKNSWQGSALWSALSVEFHKKAQKAKKDKSILPELYLE